MRIRSGVAAQRKQVAQVVRAELVYLLAVIDDVCEALLGELALDDLFFDAARGHEPVDEAAPLLAFAPDPPRRLFVRGRVPVGVEEHEAEEERVSNTGGE